MLEVPQGEQPVPIFDNTNMVAAPTTLHSGMVQELPTVSSSPSLPEGSSTPQSVLTYPDCFTEVFISPNVIVLQRKEPQGGQECLNSELLTFFRTWQMNASRIPLNSGVNQRVPRPYSSLPPLLPKPTLYPITPINNDPNTSSPPVFSSFACSGNNTIPIPNSTVVPPGTSTSMPTYASYPTVYTPMANSFPPTDTTNSTNTINPINPINPINTTNTTRSAQRCKVHARTSSKTKKPVRANTKSQNPPKRRSRNFDYCVRQMLINWMVSHKNRPYCSREEKLKLAKLTGLEVKQITMWMINSRRRKQF